MRNFLLFIALVWIVAPARAQDWCPNAKTADERTICENDYLGELDSTLSSLYARVRDASVNKRPLLEQQRAFLKRRATCKSDTSCIRIEHEKQISFFEQIGRKLTLIRDPNEPSAEAIESRSTPSLVGELVEISRIEIDYRTSAEAGNSMDSLIVANWRYESLAELKTPEADAALVSAALATRGIRSTIEHNAGRSQILGALEQFASSPRKDVFIFYYAGHAANISGHSSLLLPGFGYSADPRDDYVPISDIVNVIATLGYKKALIVFDACRNVIEVPSVQTAVADARTDTPNTRGATTLVSRSVELAALKGMDYAISFSSAEGQTALDTVNGNNSPFAEAFASNMRSKETFLDAIIETRRSVRKSTSDRQRPTLEMSWDEDLSLAGGLLKSLAYEPLTPVRKRISDIPPTLQLMDFGQWKLKYEMSSDDPCRPSGPPGTASFTPSWDLECIYREYGFDDVVTPSVLGNRADGSERFVNPDGNIVTCHSLDVVADLDADGRDEKIEFYNLNIGIVNFERDQHLARYYSPLGCNVSDVKIFDIDRGGVSDLIITFYCGPIKQCLVILSGEKLIENVGGEIGGSDVPELLRFFETENDIGLLNGLTRMTLFYDEHIKNLPRLEPEGINYDNYGITWEKGRSYGADNKSIRISRDGSVRLTSGPDIYIIRDIGTKNLRVQKIR
jgi:uncharacterized protein